jgi:hypothetical protein
MRRLLLLPIAIAAVTVAATGCGGSSSNDPLGGPLSYMPRNSPVVVAIDTDLNSDQAKQVGRLIKKIPQSDQLIASAEAGIARSSGLSYQADIKPLLGNDLVVAIPDTQSLHQSNSPTIVALKTKDAGKAKKVVSAGSTKVGSSHGADIYQDSSGGNYTALDGDTLVSADTRALLDAALARHDGGDHMTKDDFESALGSLDKSALVRGVADLQSIIANSPSSAQARKVKWVGALRDVGFTAAAKSSSIAVDIDAKTEGNLQDGDLPIASGTDAPPVVKRPGEIGIGIRDPQQIYNFALTTLQTTNPQGFGQFAAGKAELGRRLGVNFDKDVIGQLSGNSAVSLATDGKFAARAELKDPAAFKTALAKVAKGIPALTNSSTAAKVSGPSGGFYTLSSSGNKYVFGVVGKTFVLATDKARAVQFAAQSPSTVPGAQGAVALDLATRTLVNQQLQKRGVSPLAQAFTGFLGDLTGYLRADPSSLRGNFTLQLNG